MSAVDVVSQTHSSIHPHSHGSKASVSMGGGPSQHSKISISGSWNSTSKMSKFSFMERRTAFQIIVDGVDVTPDNITDPDFVTMEDTFTHAAFETKNRQQEGALKVGTKSSGEDMGMKVYATTINLDDIHIDHTIDTEEGYPPVDIDVEQAPSAFYLPKLYPPMKYPPKIFVTLKETETIYLFEQPCYSFEKGTPTGNLIEEENEYYQYITVGKGRNRKMVLEETQTRQTVSQTRHTLATRPKKKNAISFASLWDMYDTYAALAQSQEVEEEDEMVMYQSAAAYLLRKKRLKGPGGKKNKTFDVIGRLPQFNDAVMLTERVLASKDYSSAQKMFRGLVSMDPLSPDLVYVYTLKPLWVFECTETAGRPIISISFNLKNPNLLAVAHGRFSYAEKFTGIVCIWCTKNPLTPERLYRFEAPLTSVGFSERKPNWLACGFANGDVCILDITSHTKKLVAMSKRATNPSFEPVWVTRWSSAIDKEHEYVITAGQDGRINRFTSTKTHEFICHPMMRISAVEGKMKGLEVTKQCLKVDVPIVRYPAVLCMNWNPSINHIYYVGTDEGCIHTCSTHYLNQHMDVFKAHMGPVYNMERSPFLPRLLVTCGADSAIRLWIAGLGDAIMTLNCPAAVYGVAYCPINSTIIISVSGNVLSIWDLRRKTHMPCAEYTFAPNVVLTYIKFSPSGDNLFVADTTGRVHTFHLEDTPIPPYYQCRMLEEALKRALCTRPQMLRQLEKIEKFEAKQG